jgi:DNA helicase HerA-like ATPase
MVEMVALAHQTQSQVHPLVTQVAAVVVQAQQMVVHQLVEQHQTAEVLVELLL